MRTKPLDRLLFTQGGECFFCHQPLPREEASIEHLVAVTHGGKDNDENIVACCQALNTLFGRMSLKESSPSSSAAGGHSTARPVKPPPRPALRQTPPKRRTGHGLCRSCSKGCATRQRAPCARSTHSRRWWPPAGAERLFRQRDKGRDGLADPPALHRRAGPQDQRLPAAAVAGLKRHLLSIQ